MPTFIVSLSSPLMPKKASAKSENKGMEFSGVELKFSYIYQCLARNISLPKQSALVVGHLE